MIYLIDGPPRCGKTTIAKIFSNRYTVPWISADDLEGIVKKHTSKKDLEKKFPYENIKKVTKGNLDVLYERYSLQDILRSYRTAAKSTKPAIISLIDWVIHQKQNCLIEGLQIEPKLAYDLIKRYGTVQVRAVFLTKMDVVKFVQNVGKVEAAEDWIGPKVKQKITYRKIARMVQKYSIIFSEKARKYQLPVFELDTNFRRQVTAIINYLRK